jgi:hypothetical protein
MDAAATEPTVAPESRAKESPAPWVRLYSRHMMNMAILVMLPMVAAATLNYARTLMVDPDLWWHLADARFLLTTHHFIRADPFSFTSLGQHYIDWEWLSELVYWLSYQALGLRGIYVVTWMALAANILFVYWRGYWMGRSADGALWASAVAFVLMTVNSGPRMIEFGYLAMSAELAILEAADRGNKRWLWLLPPLFSLWINLHGMWFAGLAMFGIYIACGSIRASRGVFEQKAFAPAERNRLLTIFGVSVVALLVNPYGWQLMWNPLDMIMNQKLSLSTIAEWQPLNLSTLEGKGVVVAIAVMVIANCIRGRKWKIYEMIFVFLAWYAAISHVRFCYFAAVLTTPMLARDLARSFSNESDTDTIPVMNAIMTTAALGVMLFMFPSEAALQKMVEIMFPVQEIAAIQPSWRTLDYDYVGGRMAFQSRSSFIDSRFDNFEHLGIMKDYRSIMMAYDAFELMDKYRVDHALLKDDLPITYLLKHSPDWQIVMREKAWQGEYLLFAKTRGTSEASPLCTPGPSSLRQ